MESFRPLQSRREICKKPNQIAAEAPNLDAHVLRMNDLPGSKVVVHLPVRGRQNPHHAARGPVDVPLLALLDDVRSLAWTAE